MQFKGLRYVELVLRRQAYLGEYLGDSGIVWWSVLLPEQIHSLDHRTLENEARLSQGYDRIAPEYLAHLRMDVTAYLASDHALPDAYAVGWWRWWASPPMEPRGFRRGCFRIVIGRAS